jgi:hypothetical protein
MDLLLDRKQRLEDTIQSLRVERKDLVTQLSHTLTEDQITELMRFAKNIQQGLEVAKDDFEARRQIVKHLDVKVVFAVEDGEQVAYLSCSFGLDKRLRYGDRETTQKPSPRPESERTASSHVEEADNCMRIDRRNTDCRRS